ncbi:glycosyltransferase family 4 protein [Pseudodesulfovibrio indicus]|uniref:Alpha-1,3-rhamnosyl/mannosyltransferase n=1 Tax=Pseudodesulfovibrio indicus TaxID=1716143 RepID=A0A126QN29_9BACT|nr:glycosyltransferase family 1 protein [Pseudodesulfovibrio indicus]AMK11294.1 hypothetical protein AWY79_09275 [Pseudodesulfovibrio indicus]TDT85558.1 alpha-1,3-rhamnosyl/mannosyltransferase [Pseudodesulfovibrio indicus]
MKEVIVNALPMTVVGTGIGRFQRGLAGALAGGLGEDACGVRPVWFTGNAVSPIPPEPGPPGWLERVGRLLWRMPWPVAYGARLARHVVTERRFAGASRGFDVYHEAGYFPFVNGAARTVLTVHDLSLLLHPEFHPRERVRYFNRYFKDRLALAHAFCAVSEFTRRQMVEHLKLDPARIRVTAPGVDPVLFNEGDDPQARSLLDRAGTPERYVLFVGTGDPRKNADLAVAALAGTRSRLPLVTVGWAGWAAPPVGSRGRVDLGYVSDRLLAQLYRSAALLVVPSDYEGFGLPVIEAMACGCPVVVADAGALPETGGEAALVVPDVRDAAGFAACMDRIIECPEEGERLRALGFERAERFTWTRTARETTAAWLD